MRMKVNFKTMNLLLNPSGQEHGVKEDSFHGLDKSGKKKYTYNCFGYRGEEYDPLADRYIYIAGSSSTFGTGLNWEESFPYWFKKYYARHHKLSTRKVNLMNFSAGGANNDYIVRTLMTQCNVMKPDILLCIFAHKKNFETIYKGKITMVGPWDERFASFYKSPHYSNEIMLINTLKNMLLLQQYCQLKKINYIFSWLNVETLPGIIESIPEQYSFLREELNLDHFVLKSIKNKSIKVDKAADNAHAGPRSHKTYAKLLFNKYRELYGLGKEW